MAKKSSRRLTEQERAERRRQARERLHLAAEQLLSSDGWKRWVRVRSQAGLARLSISNQLLVALARPDATFVAGFNTWLRLGFAVRKGERAVAIIAPLPLKDRNRVTGQETGDTMMLFKTVFVFDRAQVDPIAGREHAPLGPPCERLTGDSHAHLLAPVQAFAESQGFSVAFESIPGDTGGWCDPKERRIVVDGDAPANAQLRILIHETVHALGVGYAEYGRERAEVIVDTATAIAVGSVGLRVDGDSIPYIAGWGETGALDAVTAFAKTIDELARRIEHVLAAAPAAAEPAVA
jgi:N-terminal domain of anti-restriction factor ArdC